MVGELRVQAGSYASGTFVTDDKQERDFSEVKFDHHDNILKGRRIG
jgi:hypothetical protein